VCLCVYVFVCVHIGLYNLHTRISRISIYLRMCIFILNQQLRNTKLWNFTTVLSVSFSEKIRNYLFMYVPISISPRCIFPPSTRHQVPLLRVVAASHDSIVGQIQNKCISSFTYLSLYPYLSLCYVSFPYLPGASIIVSCCCRILQKYCGSNLKQIHIDIYLFTYVFVSISLLCIFPISTRRQHHRCMQLQNSTTVL